MGKRLLLDRLAKFYGLRTARMEPIGQLALDGANFVKPNPRYKNLS